MTAKTKVAKSKARRPTTKKAQLIRMLSAKSGANLEVISGKLGWQTHTTRAAITGLRKAGYEVSADKADGKPTRYRITAGTPAETAAGDNHAANVETAPEPVNAG